MADPVTASIGAVSIGSSIFGALNSAKGAQVNAEAQKLQIKGQMLQTIGQAYGFKTQAQQYGYQSNINKYQAGVAEMNRTIAQQNAAYARDVGEVEATQSAMKHRAELGEMMVKQGASGLSVSGASATKVRESMIDMSYYDQSIIRAGAAKKAYGYDVEASQYKAQSDIYTYTSEQNEAQAKNALQAADISMQTMPLLEQSMGLAGKAGDIGVAGSLISGIGSVSSKWLQGNSVGMWSMKSATGIS